MTALCWWFCRSKARFPTGIRERDERGGETERREEREKERRRKEREEESLEGEGDPAGARHAAGCRRWERDTEQYSGA